MTHRLVCYGDMVPWEWGGMIGARLFLWWSGQLFACGDPGAVGLLVASFFSGLLVGLASRVLRAYFGVWPL